MRETGYQHAELWLLKEMLEKGRLKLWGKRPTCASTDKGRKMTREKERESFAAVLMVKQNRKSKADLELNLTHSSRQF